MNDKNKILDELESLEGKVSTINELVKNAKTKSLNDQTISSEELGMVVEKIEKLDVIMRDRQDTGH